jgi:hypothetical protein
MEAHVQQEVAVLRTGDFDIAIAGEFLVHEVGDVGGGFESLIEAGGEEAGFEAGGAEDGLLGEGDALDGKEFLGVDGLVDGEEVLPEVVNFLEVFEADDGEGGVGESMLAGVLGGAGPALGSAWPGRFGGVRPIRGEALGGDEARGTRHL